jgi:hypothetical protein
MREACLIACGPNRAPGRKLTPESNGIPRIATSQRSRSLSSGRRTKVDDPAYLGTIVPLTGWIVGSPDEISHPPSMAEGGC